MSSWSLCRRCFLTSVHLFFFCDWIKYPIFILFYFLSDCITFKNWRCKPRRRNFFRANHVVWTGPLPEGDLLLVISPLHLLGCVAGIRQWSFTISGARKAKKKKRQKEKKRKKVCCKSALLSLVLLVESQAGLDSAQGSATSYLVLASPASDTLTKATTKPNTPTISPPPWTHRTPIREAPPLVNVGRRKRRFSFAFIFASTKPRFYARVRRGEIVG